MHSEEVHSMPLGHIAFGIAHDGDVSAAILRLEIGKDVGEIIIRLDAGIEARGPGALVARENRSKALDLPGISDAAIADLGDDHQRRLAELVRIFQAEWAGATAH